MSEKQEVTAAGAIDTTNAGANDATQPVASQHFAKQVGPQSVVPQQQFRGTPGSASPRQMQSQ